MAPADAADGRMVTGRLDAPGLDPSLRRSLIATTPAVRTLRTALSPDGLAQMIRDHRVIVIPNPHRPLEEPT